MARRSKLDKAASRENIVQAAARLFRHGGYKGTSVDKVMQAAGLTVGAFYAHFPSKAALLAEVVQRNNQATQEVLLAPAERDLQGQAWLDRFIRSYLSEAHRDGVDRGCLLPALASELPRLGPEAKRALESALTRSLQAKASQFGPRLSQAEAEDRIIALICLGVGAIALARAVPSKAFSSKILRAAQKQALR